MHRSPSFLQRDLRQLRRRLHRGLRRGSIRTDSTWRSLKSWYSLSPAATRNAVVAKFTPISRKIDQKNRRPEKTRHHSDRTEQQADHHERDPPPTS